MEVSGFLPAAVPRDASVCQPDARRMTHSETTPDAGWELGRLRKRAEFLRARGGRSWAARSLVLQARQRPGDAADAPRFGFTATKRLGSAVQRNRARRRLKEAVRRIAPRDARGGFDYVVIARQPVLSHAFPDIVKDLQTALKKVHQNAKRR